MRQFRRLRGASIENNSFTQALQFDHQLPSFFSKQPELMEKWIEEAFLKYNHDPLTQFIVDSMFARFDLSFHSVSDSRMRLLANAYLNLGKTNIMLSMYSSEMQRLMKKESVFYKIRHPSPPKLEKLLSSKKPLAFLIWSGISIPSPSNLMSGDKLTEQILIKPSF